jgi:hypothetical protein
MLVGLSIAADVGIGPFLPWLRVRDHVPPDAGELFVARDPGLERDGDDAGYDLRAAGEGPFAVLYRPSPLPATAVIRVDGDGWTGIRTRRCW